MTCGGFWERTSVGSPGGVGRSEDSGLWAVALSTGGHHPKSSLPQKEHETGERSLSDRFGPSREMA